MPPTIRWDGGLIRMIDQRSLPGSVQEYTCRSYRDVIRAIRNMVIRGAPAIGAAAAMGMAQAARTIRASSSEAFLQRLEEIGAQMRQARPTAVNLAWAVERMLALSRRLSRNDPAEIAAALREESERILQEDVEANRAIGRHGEPLVPQGATILTHCNAGALATCGYGTALGVIRAAWEKGKGIRVIADETRPWLQGLRLTAFELIQEGIPVTVIADSATGFLMQQGRIDLVITGADRIAANGDVANKIGTYSVAVLAHVHGIPFYVAAPISTIDPALESGADIPVEERSPQEICRVGRVQMGPPGLEAYNPVFDITPARYVSGIITQEGVIRPPYPEGIARIFKA